MRIVITGGGGFVGTALARRLLQADGVAVGGADPGGVDELVLADLVAPADDLAADARVVPVVGDLLDVVPDLGPADLVFHLAGVVSGAAEADFDLGWRGNLDATRAVLEHCRALPAPPVLVFSSTGAVFGSDPAIGPLGTIDDDTLPRPQTSYGAQKFASELLIADYARKGFVRGRSVRLMTVTVRPGKPNAAASSFASGLIREPVAGVRAVCPVPPGTPIVVSSPRRTLDGLVAAAAVDDRRWGSLTAMNLPGITTTPKEMAESLDRVVGAGTSDLIDWVEDPVVTAIVRSWLPGITTARAATLGLEPEASFDDIVAAYVADASGATSSPLS